MEKEKEIDVRKIRLLSGMIFTLTVSEESDLLVGGVDKFGTPTIIQKSTIYSMLPVRGGN